jgi:hypothetical protein
MMQGPQFTAVVFLACEVTSSETVKYETPPSCVTSVSQYEIELLLFILAMAHSFTRDGLYMALETCKKAIELVYDSFKHHPFYFALFTVGTQVLEA